MRHRRTTPGRAGLLPVRGRSLREGETGEGQDSGAGGDRRLAGWDEMVLSLETAHRESESVWSSFLRGLKTRALRCPPLVTRALPIIDILQAVKPSASMRKVLAVVYTPAVLLLAITWYQDEVPSGDITRDAIAVAGLPFYVGAISSLGIVSGRRPHPSVFSYAVSRVSTA